MSKFEYAGAVRVIVVTVYYPGSSQPNSKLFTEFEISIAKLSTMSAQVSTIGHMNIRLDRQTILATICCHFSIPLVSLSFFIPNQCLEGWLDVIITRDDSYYWNVLKSIT